MNKNQLKEVERIGAILLETFDEINRAYRQLDNALYIAQSEEERREVLMRQSAEADNLSLAEYKAHTIAYNTIKHMHAILAKDNGLAVETLLIAIKRLRKQTEDELNACHMHLGVSIEEYKAMKPLQNTIDSLDALKQALNSKSNPSTPSFNILYTKE